MTASRKIVAGPWRTLASAVAAASLVAGPLQGQVPVTSLGLGYPPPPVDARAAGLGGSGLGLVGGSLSSRNPADLGLFEDVRVGGTLAPESVDVESSSASESTGRSRLSVLQAVLPAGEWTVGFGFSSELDLDWSVALRDTLETSFGSFPFDERREHNGGVSSLNVGVERRIGRFSAGAGVDVLTGGLRQTFRRDFEPAVDDPNSRIGFASGNAEWSFSSWRIRGGVTARVSERGLLSATLSWTDGLSATRDSAGVERTRRTFDMPLSLEVGGSARVTPRFLVAAGVGWKGWSDTDVSDLGYESADVWWLGAGVELTGTRLLGLGVPLRAGYRRSELPFYPEGRAQLTESALTLGLGARVAGGQAVLDFGLEIGSRGNVESSGVGESFRRFHFTIAIIQR